MYVGGSSLSSFLPHARSPTAASVCTSAASMIFVAEDSNAVAVKAIAMIVAHDLERIMMAIVLRLSHRRMRTITGVAAAVAAAAAAAGARSVAEVVASVAVVIASVVIVAVATAVAAALVATEAVVVALVATAAVVVALVATAAAAASAIVVVAVAPVEVNVAEAIASVTSGQRGSTPEV